MAQKPTTKVKSFTPASKVDVVKDVSSDTGKVTDSKPAAKHETTVDLPTGARSHPPA